MSQKPPKKASNKTAETPEIPSAEESPANLAEALAFLSRWNAELVEFYARRYQQYGLLPLRLLSCRTAEDFQDVQRSFLEKLSADYRAEAETLSHVAGCPPETMKAAAEAGYAVALQKAQEDAAVLLDEAKAQAERIIASAEEQARQMTARTDARDEPEDVRKSA